MSRGRASLPSLPRALVLAAAFLAVAAPAVWLVLRGGDETPSRTKTYVIPKGAKRSIERGTRTVAIPERIAGHVGDVLLIDNKDVAVHFIAGYSVASGQTLRIPLRRAGKFVTDCSLHRDRDVEIVVSPR